MNDKKHWYDGKFYDKLIAPNQDKMFYHIRGIIKDNSKVLDVGCGTGRLAFQLSEQCELIVGLDLSSTNISVADANLKINPKTNISFVHGDIKKIKKDYSDKFDYAVLTYVIHEIPENERIKVLTDIKSVADKIIIGDYIVPTPKSLMGILNIIVEYFAGKEHYANFKSYVKNGGLKYLTKMSNLDTVEEIKNKPSTAHLVVAK